MNYWGGNKQSDSFKKESIEFSIKSHPTPIMDRTLSDNALNPRDSNSTANLNFDLLKEAMPYRNNT